MTDVLIVFGSSSDSRIYDEIQKNVPSSTAMACSAHRSPDILESAIKSTDAKVIVGGAGLAAHLPGVVAAKTIRPVIGVPVSGSFQGLDALLSIVQMPPGIPVMCVGVDNAHEAAKYARMMLKQHEGVTITGETGHERAKKAIEILEKFKVPHETGVEASEKNINIHLGNAAEERGLTINVPLIDTSKPANALQLMQMMKSGLWVGVGRAENAALAAVEILNLDGRYTKALNDYRAEMRGKIIAEMKKPAEKP
jgi:5-(carboxyamino)imidazole ribonucleotide mutase